MRVPLRVVAFLLGYNGLGLLLHLALEVAVGACVQHLLVAFTAVGVRFRHVASQLLVHGEGRLAVPALVLVRGVRDDDFRSWALLETIASAVRFFCKRFV